ncbi:MAG TPA: inorganic phosphate transporter, partial [Chromatiaceae bacterium]|nr:inorganic phosphate transporter [Chromatiaceae bacterium]
SDMIEASKRMVPILIGVMTWAFSSYLIIKGLKKIWKVDFTTALGLGLLIAVAIYFLVKPLVAKQASMLDNEKGAVNRLFTLPLIFAAALLSFAHGANDVANAVGPLAAIHDAIVQGGIHKKAAIPMWVMMVGAIGIAIGLALYGPKLIRTVGSEITELDQMRAFSIAMAAAITVIIATQLGLPVSSTHIAVGAVFGVGFLREFLKTSYARMIEEIKEHHAGEDHEVIETFLNEFRRASVNEKGRMLAELKRHKAKAELTKKERKGLKKIYRKELVKRSAFMKIVAAWVITVPASALMAALLYYTIRGMML